jgi:hypothetical protein
MGIATVNKATMALFVGDDDRVAPERAREATRV